MNNLLFPRHPDAVDRSEKARARGWRASASTFSMQIFPGVLFQQKIPVGAGPRSCAHFAGRFNMVDAFASVAAFFGAVFLVRAAS